MVPPQPISMSSECAPKQRTLREASLSRGRLSDRIEIHSPQSAGPGGALLAILPHFPGGRAGSPQVFEFLFVFERVHGSPKSVVGIANQLLFVDEALERTVDEFLFFANVIEDAVVENEIAAIDAHRAVVDGMNSRNQIA